MACNRNPGDYQVGPCPQGPATCIPAGACGQNIYDKYAPVNTTCYSPVTKSTYCAGTITASQIGCC